jgi:hypothetical protein
MNAALETKLASGINYILEGRQTSPNGTKISKRHVLIYSGGDINGAAKQIESWERQGVLKILKQLQDALDDELCIELNQFIGQKSPIKGWLNWK